MFIDKIMNGRDIAKAKEDFFPCAVNSRQIRKQMRQQVKCPRPAANKPQILDVIIGQCLDQIFRPRPIGIDIAEVGNLLIKVLSIDLKTLPLQRRNNIRDVVLVIFR